MGEYPGPYVYIPELIQVQQREESEVPSMHQLERICESLTVVLHGQAVSVPPANAIAEFARDLGISPAVVLPRIQQVFRGLSA